MPIHRESYLDNDSDSDEEEPVNTYSQENDIEENSSPISTPPTKLQELIIPDAARNVQINNSEISPSRKFAAM
jgi:hypothetical protein